MLLLGRLEQGTLQQIRRVQVSTEDLRVQLTNDADVDALADDVSLRDVVVLG